MLGKAQHRLMAPPPLTPLRSGLQLFCVLGLSVALPMLVCRSHGLENWLGVKAGKLKPVMRASGGIQDAEGGKAVLRRDRPDWILLGNSMLNSRVEDSYLEELSGQRLYKLSFSGTKSAMWFLMLKKIVIESGVHPRCVTLFFRDRDLIRPELRAEDNAEMIDRLKGRDEPEWKQVMGSYEAKRFTPWQQLTNRVEKSLAGAYPADDLREWSRGKIEKRAFDVSSIGAGGGERTRRSERNDLLSMDHMRKTAEHDSDAALEAMLAAAEDLERHQPMLFDSSPDHSFLPHMVRLAKDHGIKLHLHRIKTNPDLPQLGPDEERVLQTYLSELKAYAERENCLYSDETGEKELTGDLFVDSMHIRTTPREQQLYMRIFWRHVSTLIQAGVGDAITQSRSRP